MDLNNLIFSKKKSSTTLLQRGGGKVGFEPKNNSNRFFLIIFKLNLILSLAFLFLFFSCQNEKGTRNIEAYYFPLNELKKGKVYEYQPIGNEFDPPIFWYYKSMKQDDGYYLLGMGYDPEFNPDQFIREEKVSNGMLLLDFYTYESVDSVGNKTQVQADIAAGNVFPFYVKKPANVLLTSLSWKPEGEDGAKINLVRNRQFTNDTSFVFKNKNIPSVIFKTIELIEHDEQGRLPIEYDGTEVYAKNIGLVRFKKNISKGYQMAYELKDIYTMEEFEEKFRIKIGLVR